MGLRFILGGSGTGKSYRMYSDMIRRGDNCLAIVPEQFTMETQKTIVNLSECHGTMSVDILSFQRLAKRIFDEAGLNTLTLLDDTGKCLILRKVIEENKDKLTIFGSKVRMAGFIEEMKSMICELYQYGISDDKFDEMLGKAKEKPLLYAKLQDIQLISVKLKEYLNDRFVMNEELLQKVCELIPNSKLIKNSHVTFDEYTGFSTVQYDVITALLKYAKSVTIALTVRDADRIDYSRESETNIFNLTIKTVNRLKRIAKDENVEVYSDIVLTKPYRFREHRPLLFLEKNLFRYRVNPYTLSENEKDSISIHVCGNQNGEAEYVACTIRNLVAEEGYRYKDIAVVTADIEGYHRSVTEQFERHGIPCFIDYKKSIIANPMVESIRAVIEIITDNYSYESVFRYLKCGMSGLTRREIDLLENYVISHGIRGYKKWNHPIEDNEELEMARQKVLEDTSDLYENLKKRNLDVKTAITALTDFINGLNMEEKLEGITEEFYESGEIGRAKEFAQTYELVMELLLKMENLIGDEKIKAKEISAMLDSGFEEIKVGTIPPTLDKVVVGDIERTRLGDIKVLFLIGANDGIIPWNAAKTGVLTRSERNFLADSGVELSPTVRENAFIQKFYLYRIFTKMSDRLYISFKRSNGDGSSARQSYIIGSIYEMYHGMDIVDEDRKANTGAEACTRVTNLESAIFYVAEHIQDYLADKMSEEEKNVFREMYVTCLREELGFNQESGEDGNVGVEAHKNADCMDKILRAATYCIEPARIDRAVARAIYGDNLHNSVSRLETFAACAYRHFIYYGLMLAERKEYIVERNDIGNIYHNAIELFFKKIRERNISYDKLDDELRKMIIGESVDEASRDRDENIFTDTGRNRYMLEKIKRISDKTVWVLINQIQAGSFIPAEFEVRFSSDYGLDKLKYIYDDGTQMGLRGVIDRVDYYQDGDDIYVKIVDYKSGYKKFEVNDIYNGLQLQLVVYMEAALELTKKKNPNKNVIPAGMFYYNIDDPVVKAEDVISDNETEMLENVRREVLKKQRINGTFVDDEEVLEALDGEVEELRESGGDSVYAPLGFTKKGEFKKNSAQITDSSMKCLIDFVHDSVGKIGRKIIDGDIDINPYSLAADGGKMPCDYCDYKQICGFDKNIKGCNPRVLMKADSEKIWKIIRQGGDDDGKMDQ